MGKRKLFPNAECVTQKSTGSIAPALDRAGRPLRVQKHRGAAVCRRRDHDGKYSRFVVGSDASRVKAMDKQIALVCPNYATSPLVTPAVRRILHSRWRGTQTAKYKRGIESTVTVDDLERLYNQNEGCCAISSLPFDVGDLDAAGGRSRKPFRPSIDRIDSTHGYTPDNVRLVCSCINYALGPWGEAVLRVMCGAVAFRARSSVEERSLHTREAASSILAAPTTPEVSH